MIVSEIWTLVKKDILIELRMKYAISGMALYLLSSIFLGYITFSLGRVNINAPTWNALFWVVMLFVATNSIAKSFIQESRERMLYYYTIANPLSIIISKIINIGQGLGYDGLILTAVPVKRSVNRCVIKVIQGIDP